MLRVARSEVSNSLAQIKVLGGIPSSRVCKRYHNLVSGAPDWFALTCRLVNRDPYLSSGAWPSLLACSFGREHHRFTAELGQRTRYQQLSPIVVPIKFTTGM